MRITDKIHSVNKNPILKSNNQFNNFNWIKVIDGQSFWMNMNDEPAFADLSLLEELANQFDFIGGGNFFLNCALGDHAFFI